MRGRRRVSPGVVAAPAILLPAAREPGGEKPGYTGDRSPPQRGGPPGGAGEKYGGQTLRLTRCPPPRQLRAASAPVPPIPLREAKKVLGDFPDFFFLIKKKIKKLGGRNRKQKKYNNKKKNPGAGRAEG